MTARIAFLGMGAMGSRMAHRLVDAGHGVTVWNRSPAACEPLAAKGASVAKNPAEAARGADLVFSMLTDDAASRAVWLAPETGAVHGLGDDALAIESGTVTREWVLELGEAVVTRGAQLIDGPVAGSRPQAEAGTLIFMLGGEEVLVERAMPALQAMGGAFHHLGPLGNAALFKLAVNAIFAVQIAGMAEVLTLLSRFGFNESVVAEKLSQFPVVSPSLAGVARLMAARATTPLFTIDLVTKDLGYTLNAAKACGLDLKAATTTRSIFEAARQEGFGQDNITALIKLYMR